MTSTPSGEERLLDLLIKRTLEGVDLDEAREITLLLDEHPLVQPQGLENTVAALDAIALGDQPPLPDSIRAAVMARLAPAQLNQAAKTTPPNGSAWPWLAVAASVLLAGAGWWQALWSAEPTWVNVRRTQPTLPPPVDSGPSDRERVYGDPGKLVVPFVATDQSSGMRGIVYWSGASQLGYMELDGLAINEPTIEQYQLWIFDATRSDAQPVDGGVFDIATSGSNVVEVQAKLLVRAASLFAITVEPPGGSVVSTRERLLALATPSSQ